MHPAFSVILFTTSSGAGYGLLMLMGIFGASGLLPNDRWFGLSGLVIALGLVSIGLLSSTFHLGHPERSWRAISQWRSSWLSREGVLAIVTFIPAGLLGIGWVFYETTEGFWGIMGILSALLAILTVLSTAMIYRSLKTIHQWANSWTLPGYISLSVMTGAILLSSLLLIFDERTRAVHGLVIFTIIIAWLVKYVYWHFIATSKGLPTPSSAIAVDGMEVAPLDPPHNSANYLMKEMGFSVARKHADKLRLISYITLFALPLGLSLVAYLSGGALGTISAVVATASATVGVGVERWLFFAEAKHTVNLYYGVTSV